MPFRSVMSSICTVAASWHLSRGTDILVPNVRKGTGAIVSSLEEASPRPDRLPVEQLQGIVERVTFHSEESGYTVLRFNLPGERELVTVIGSFPEIHAGQTLRLTGYYREHPKYGRQFQCLHAQETKPATLTGLEKYLGSGLIKGIGPVTAKRIVTHFGLETLEIIEHSCSRLIEIPGIGERRVAMIERAWESPYSALRRSVNSLLSVVLDPRSRGSARQQRGIWGTDLVSRFMSIFFYCRGV